MISLVFILLTLAAATTQASVDLSSPQLAVQAMQNAIERGDADALANILYSTNEDQQKQNAAYSAMIIASKRLADAIAAKFGSTGDMLALAAAALPDVKNIAPTDITSVNDRTVTIKLRGRPRLITLHRDDSASWRIDLLSFADVSADDLTSQLAMLSDLSRLFNELAIDVRDDRYHTIGDVKAAIQDRVHTAIARSLRHDHPTTAASTKPS